MNDKVYKYSEFLTETILATPEKYIRIALKKLQKRIEKMFSGAEIENGEVKRFGEKQDLDRKEEGKMSFVDLGLQLQSLELSRHSKLYHRLKLVFSDEEYKYDLTITIDLRDAIPQDKEKDYSDKEIKKCQIDFKKYSLDDFQMVEMAPETADIEDIDEEFIIKLKIKMDENDEGDKEEFEIETQ